MKNPEEYLNKFCKEENPNGDRVFFKEDIIKAIEAAQKDAYNEALDDVVENVDTKEDVSGYMRFGDMVWVDTTSEIVDEDSILKLKKK